MIEIRVNDPEHPTYEGDPITPDGPHDHEQTRAVAAGIDEAFRLLNYATMSRAGLVYPGDVYSVLGELAAAIFKLPQALGQMSEFIGAQVAAGEARENPATGGYGGNTEAAAATLTGALASAARTATTLGSLLEEAQASLRGMESTRQDQDAAV